MARYAGFRKAAKLAEATFAPSPASMSLPTKPANKYHAKKTKVDGIVFQSKKEAERYKELKLLWYAGEILNLTCQQKYPLTVNGELIAHYVADFTYFDCATSTHAVEDCKGYRTPVYKLKKKLFEALYGTKITET